MAVTPAAFPRVLSPSELAPSLYKEQCCHFHGDRLHFFVVCGPALFVALLFSPTPVSLCVRFNIQPLLPSCPHD